MSADLEDELAGLQTMSTGELCERYEQLFGQPVRTRHKVYLVRKIAWRIQAMAEGACRSGHGGGPRNWPTTPTCG